MYIVFYQVLGRALLSLVCAICPLRSVISLRACFILDRCMRPIHWTIVLLGCFLVLQSIVRDIRPLMVRVFCGRKHRGRRDGPIRHGALSATDGGICACPSHCGVVKVTKHMLAGSMQGKGGCVMFGGEHLVSCGRRSTRSRSRYLARGPSVVMRVADTVIFP